MRRFKEGEQIYTSYQVQIEPDNNDQEDEEVDLDLTEQNEDYVEFQNYLSVVGKWYPKSLVNLSKGELHKMLHNEDIEAPRLDDFVNNNFIVGKAAKEITDYAFNEEIEQVNNEQISKLQEAKSRIPSYMPLKLLLIGEKYEGCKEVYDKLKAEFNLKIFDVAEVTAEIEKVLNPPKEEEVPDPKKAKGKQVIEEPPDNQEELKELAIVAEKIKQHREENPGYESIPEDLLMEVFAIKIKYSFQEKDDAQILAEIKQGIRQDIFREPEEEVDPKKAKGKGPSKEELEEELSRYKKVQPSGYLITGLPKSREVLERYEVTFNGYTPPEGRPETEFERARAVTAKVFPCSLGGQNEYALEPHGNYLIK